MNYREFLAGFVTAYRHRGGIKTLKLGAIDDDWFREMQNECAWVINSAGSSDVTSPDHVTHWTRPSGQVRQFSLFNATGASDDTRGDYGYLGDARKKKLVFPELGAIARFARMFQSALRNLRLNGMGCQSALNAHEEGSIHSGKSGLEFIARFHLPIFTNPMARVFLDDESFRYEEGSLYFFNHGCVHAAENRGENPRYHLVLDCFLDQHLFERLFPGHPSPDDGFRKLSDAEAAVLGEPFHFPNFAREDGSIISGGIDYDRRKPQFLDYYRKNYPSVFRLLPGHHA